jgi:hypothetical protein
MVKIPKFSSCPLPHARTSLQAQVHDKSGSVDPLLGPDSTHPYIDDFIRMSAPFSRASGRQATKAYSGQGADIVMQSLEIHEDVCVNQDLKSIVYMSAVTFDNTIGQYPNSV